MQERRKLEAGQGTSKTGMVDVIVVIPEAGRPLAIIPVDSKDNKIWKEVPINLLMHYTLCIVNYA